MSPTKPTGRRTQFRDVTAIVLIALAMNAVFFGVIGAGRPEYLQDYRLANNPDASHYLLMGHNIWELGEYSRMSGPPYTPDPVRGPVFPVVAGGLDVAAGGVWAVFLFHVLCHAATAVVVYLLAAKFVGRGRALAAALLIAANAMLAIMNFEAMSEPLFMLLVTLAVLLWIPGVLEVSTGFPRVRTAVLVGVLLGLASLTRSTSLYLPIVLACIQAGVGLRRRHWRAVCCAGVLFLVACTVVGSWRMWRHHALTTEKMGISSHIVYNAGAGAYQVELGVSREEAQEMIRSEHNLFSFQEMNNPWIIDPDNPEKRANPRVALWQVLFKYPKSLVKSSVLGQINVSISHNVSELARMSGRTWTPPSKDLLLQGHIGEFGARLFRNDVLLVVVFVWEMTLALAVLAGGCLGVVWGLCRPRWRLTVTCLLLVAAYYGLTNATVGIDVYYRYRTMIVPLWCLLAVIGYSEVGRWIVTRVRGRRIANGVDKLQSASGCGSA